MEAPESPQKQYFLESWITIGAPPIKASDKANYGPGGMAGPGEILLFGLSNK